MTPESIWALLDRVGLSAVLCALGVAMLPYWVAESKARRKLAEEGIELARSVKSLVESEIRGLHARLDQIDQQILENRRAVQAMNRRD